MSGLFSGTPLERPVTCPHCGKSLDACACPRGRDGRVVLPGDQPVRVHREKRRGKWLTVITGLNAHATDCHALLKELKSTCAAGGTVGGDDEEPRVEVQGDHRDRIVDLMRQRGFPAKAAGG